MVVCTKDSVPSSRGTWIAFSSLGWHKSNVASWLGFIRKDIRVIVIFQK